MIRLLFLGDTFGRPGRKAIAARVPDLKKEQGIHVVVANGENIAGGKGLTPDLCRELFQSGVDVITTGNHLLDQKVLIPYLFEQPRVVRPINLSSDIPGKGYVLIPTPNGAPLAVVCAMGMVHFKNVTSPFGIVGAAVKELREVTRMILVDMHAEATSEKRAMGWYLDGQVSAVLGTHTHVQTADEEILPGGTAYMTDVGMTGPYDSVIGLRTDIALERFVEGKTHRFDVAKGDVRLCGALVDIDPRTGRALSVTRVCERLGALEGA